MADTPLTPSGKRQLHHTSTGKGPWIVAPKESGVWDLQTAPVKIDPDTFLQSLRPQDVAHQRQQLVRWWSYPGEWQHTFALQGRQNIPGWLEHPEREAEQARWWMEDTLRKAELYWVSPEMTEVITTLAPSIPDCLPQPPVKNAFVIFAKAMSGTDAESGETIFTSAFLWSTIDLYKIGPCIAMESYTWRDLVGLYQGLSDEDRGHFRDIYPNRLMPTGGSEWPLNALTSEFGTLPMGTDTQKASMLEDRRLLSTFWALCSQKIVIETRHEPSRAERRTAQREGRALEQTFPQSGYSA